jgi:ubiquinone/menaquinone biosynthesis C-methylase UbiE
VQSWHHQVTDSAAFEKVLAAVLAAVEPHSGQRCADLGCGTGFVTLPILAAGASVVAVDASPGMIQSLRGQVADPSRITLEVADLARFDLPAQSLDAVVSSYALHHLSHRDKELLLQRAFAWLAPGGRLVVADMMFGRGASPRDRAILVSKARLLLAKGPGGVVRLVRNLARFGLRVGSERPASPEFWQRAAQQAGFVDVQFQPVVAEAGLLVARRPG